MSRGFGLVPIKAEGRAAHPDSYGIGSCNGHKFEADATYLRQLQAYTNWRGLDMVLQESCERPWLLDKLVESTDE